MFNYAMNLFNEEVISEPLGIEPNQFWETIRLQNNIYTTMIAITFE